MKIERAGPYVDVVVYPIAKGRGSKKERAAARTCSSDLQQRANDRTSFARLKRLIACNFSPMDWVITLTYDDQTLPATPERARDLYFKPFIRRIRKETKPLKYVYVIEGMHGDKRLHHHMIIPDFPGLKESIQKEWFAGYVDFARIDSRGYEEWARYLTKEPRKTGRRYVGDRMWTPSIGLTKPEVETYEVPDSYRYEPPPGAVITTAEDWRTEWWTCQYVSFYEPDYLRKEPGLDQQGENACEGLSRVGEMSGLQAEQETAAGTAGDKSNSAASLLPSLQDRDNIGH